MGLACFGIQGALLGPLLVCAYNIVYCLFGQYIDSGVRGYVNSARKRSNRRSSLFSPLQTTNPVPSSDANGSD